MLLKKKVWFYLGNRELINWMPDKLYLSKVYREFIGKKLNLQNPETFNEKIQWLKLNDRHSEYTTMVDKYEAKKWVADRIGEEYIIPTLGIWNKFDEINFESLPTQFVLKCTHNSGGIVICKDKETLDFKTAKKIIENALKRNYFYAGREWPYKNVQPRIIAEQYLDNEKLEIDRNKTYSDYIKHELTDYKLMCFNGQVRCIFTCTERFSQDGLKVTFFDTNWNRLPFSRHYPISSLEIKPPTQLNKMIQLANILSKDIPFVRVDFYEVASQIYFGEMTFYPGSGLEEFNPEIVDTELGCWINLPKIDIK